MPCRLVRQKNLPLAISVMKEIVKTNNRVGLLIVSSSSHDRALEESATSIMENAIEHLKGPPDKMVVGEGSMEFPGGKYEFITARFVDATSLEGVQVDFISPTADSAIGISSSGRQYRIVRNGEKTNTITFLPSLRRSRIIPYIPLDGVLGSEQRFYFLPLVSVLRSFSYTTSSRTDKTVILRGVPILEVPFAPFSVCTVKVEQKGGVFIPLSLACECMKGICEGIISQEFSDYVPIEKAEGFWAPGKIQTGATKILFSRWVIQEPVDWIISPNHTTLGGRYTLIPPTR